MQRVGNHLLFWTAYVAFKTYLNVSADATLLISDGQTDISKITLMMCAQLSFLIIKVPLVYYIFNIINRYLEKKISLLKSVILFALSFGIGMILMSLINHVFILPILFNFNGFEQGVLDVSSLLYHFFTLAFVVGIASSIQLLRKQYQSKLLELQLQKDKTEAELKYLKGQINPHFLFNTLNNIYSLARKKSEKTPEAIMKLSQLMRFMLYESKNNKILIKDELKIIEDYIQLEKLRYTDKLKIEFIKNIDNTHQEIAPLLLIHFVENAFKHGASESRFDSFIDIEIKLKNGLLTAKITNSKEENSIVKDEGQIGLENIKRQLELIYPNHHLIVENTSYLFSIELKIQLNKPND